MNHAGETLILTGPPGSGKTTTARAIADMPGSAKVHLHSDDFWHFIRHGAIPPYLPQADAQNALVLDILAQVAAGYAAGGYFVILDGIVGPWFLPAFGAIALPVHYVVLRPPVDVTIGRCRARGGNTLTDPEPIAALHRQFSMLGPLERHVLHESELPPDKMRGAVIAAVESGTFRLSTA